MFQSNYQHSERSGTFKLNIVLLGSSGHCIACIDVIESTGSFTIHGIVTENHEHGKLYGYPILGTDEVLESLVRPETGFVIAVGQIKSPVIRQKLFKKLNNLKASLPVIAASTAFVSPRATIGQSVIVMHGAMVCANAIIEANSIVNTNASVEHGVEVGPHCHIATGARVNGDAKIGAGTFIGSGAVIGNGVSVGEGCVISAGSTVLSDLKPHTFIRSIKNGK